MHWKPARVYVTPRLRAAYKVLNYVHKRGVNTSKNGRCQWCPPHVEKDLQDIARIIAREQQALQELEKHDEQPVPEMENSTEPTETRSQAFSHLP